MSRWTNNEASENLAAAYRVLRDDYDKYNQGDASMPFGVFRTSLDNFIEEADAATADMRAANEKAIPDPSPSPVAAGSGQNGVLNPCPTCRYTAWAISAETNKVLYCAVCGARENGRDFKTERDEARTLLATTQAQLAEAKLEAARYKDQLEDKDEHIDWQMLLGLFRILVPGLAITQDTVPHVYAAAVRVAAKTDALQARVERLEGALRKIHTMHFANQCEACARIAEHVGDTLTPPPPAPTPNPASGG